MRDVYGLPPPSAMLFKVVSLSLLAAVSGLRIVNENVKRTIFLTGEVVREEHLITARFSDQDPAISSDVPAELVEEIHDNWFPNYVALVAPDAAKNLAGFDAAEIDTNNGETSPLQITEITSEMNHCER